MKFSRKLVPHFVVAFCLILAETLFVGEAKVLRERRYKNARLALGKEYDEVVVAYHDDCPVNMISASKNMSRVIYEKNVPWNITGASLFIQKLRKSDWIIFDKVFYWIQRYSIPRILFNSSFIVYSVFSGLVLYKFYINLYKFYDGLYPFVVPAPLPSYNIQLDGATGIYSITTENAEVHEIPGRVFALIQPKLGIQMTVTKSRIFKKTLQALENPPVELTDIELRSVIAFAQDIAHDQSVPSHMIPVGGKVQIWPLVKSLLYLEVGFMIQHVVYQSMLVYCDKPTIGESLKKMSEFFIYHKTHDEMLMFMASNMIADHFYKTTETLNNSFWTSVVWSLFYYILRRLVRFIAVFCPDHAVFSFSLYISVMALGTGMLIDAKEAVVSRWQRSLYWKMDAVNIVLGQPHLLFVKNNDYGSTYWRRLLNPANKRLYWWVQGIYTTLLFVVPTEIIYNLARQATKSTLEESPSSVKKVSILSKLFSGTRFVGGLLWNLLKLDFRVSAIPIVHGCSNQVSGFDSILSFIDSDIFKGLPVFENAFGTTLVIIIILGQYASEYSF